MVMNTSVGLEDRSKYTERNPKPKSGKDEKTVMAQLFPRMEVERITAIEYHIAWNNKAM